ncbi:MAG: hypothetical protein ACFFD4_34720 [Candidatus Odinarchaeota archaeon]
MFTLCARLRELKPELHPFWEEGASYTFKDRASNFFFRTEEEVISSLLEPRLNSDTLILNLGSGNPQRLIDFLITKRSRHYLVNLDISSRVIKRADEYCERSGFQQDNGVFSKHALYVDNIRADVLSLPKLKNLSKLRNEIRNEYPRIFILALNCLHNLYAPEDEGLTSTSQVINFFRFGDAFFTTMLSFNSVRDRLAFYQRHIEPAELVQLRMVYSSHENRLFYGLKIEKKLQDIFNGTEQDITRLISGKIESGDAKGVIIDFLTADCQHTGYRTLLVTPIFTRYLFQKNVPEFEIDLCGYPENEIPPSPVLFPVGGKSRDDNAEQIIQQ